MDFSFTGIYVSISFIILMLIISAILFFIAGSYLETTNSNTSISNNNKTAKFLLFGAGIITSVLLFLYFIFIFIIYGITGRYGIGSYLLLIVSLILIMIAVVLAIIAIFYIDGSSVNINGGTARELAIAGAIITFITMIFVFYIIYKLYNYNTYLNTVPTNEVIVPTTPLLNAPLNKNVIENNGVRYYEDVLPEAGGVMTTRRTYIDENNNIISKEYYQQKPSSQYISKINNTPIYEQYYEYALQNYTDIIRIAKQNQINTVMAMNQLSPDLPPDVINYMKQYV
jgi:hypothetical protein